VDGKEFFLQKNILKPFQLYRIVFFRLYTFFSLFTTDVRFEVFTSMKIKLWSLGL